MTYEVRSSNSSSSFRADAISQIRRAATMWSPSLFFNRDNEDQQRRKELSRITMHTKGTDMRTKFFVLLGASVLLVGSITAVPAAPLGVAHQACTADLKSLCAGITGQVKVRECFLSHMDNLYAACSDALSEKLSIVKECAGDVTDYCGSVKSGHEAIAKCLKGHLREVSRPCRAQLALSVAPDK
jgi:hypothetical protein